MNTQPRKEEEPFCATPESLETEAPYNWIEWILWFGAAIMIFEILFT